MFGNSVVISDLFHPYENLILTSGISHPSWAAAMAPRAIMATKKDFMTAMLEFYCLQMQQQTDVSSWIYNRFYMISLGEIYVIILSKMKLMFLANAEL